MGVEISANTKGLVLWMRDHPEHFQGKTTIEDAWSVFENKNPPQWQGFKAAFRREVKAGASDEDIFGALKKDSEKPHFAGSGGDFVRTASEIQAPPPQPPPPPPGPTEEEIEAQVRKELQEEFAAPIREQFERLFPILKEAGEERIRQQFVPLRKRLTEQEAVLGRLRSPIGAVGEKALAGEEGLALSQFMGQAAAQRLSGETDLSKTIQAFLTEERRAREQVGQFGQELGLRRDIFEQSKKEAEEERKLARILGELGAEAQKPKKKSFWETLAEGLIPKIGIDIPAKFSGKKKKKEEEGEVGPIV